MLGFTNTSNVTCALPHVDHVTGRHDRPDGADTVIAMPGRYFPIRPTAPTVAAGDRAELVLSTTALDLCQPAQSVMVTAITVALSDGSVSEIPVSIDAGCGIQYSQFGSWD